MGTSDIALERVQALLKVDTGSGSLDEHLVRIVRLLASEKPSDALAQIENLSRDLKLSTFRGVPAEDDAKAVVVDAAGGEKLQQWCADTLSMVASVPKAVPAMLGAVQNFAEDAAMFQWAGVGFGKQESYAIAMSLRKLAADTPTVEKLRFWGKVLGLNADYYVAEGKFMTPPGAVAAPPTLPDTPEDDVEAKGEGANTFTYWVSTGPSTPWVRLPAARASHIMASRSIKRMLTGDLAAPVLSTPWFPGMEKHLLRAQIARITASCSLSVSGFYEPDEEAIGKNKIKEVEGALEAFPGHDELKAQSGWKHASPFLFSNGKSGWPDFEALAEDPKNEGKISEEEKAAIEAKIAAEGEHGMLEGIETDLEELKGEDAPEGSLAWSIKVYGDQGLYTVGDAAKTYRVTAVKSLIWPGAVAVAQGTKFANIYVGTATKCGSLVPPQKESGEALKGTAAFQPLIPGDIMDEPNDLEEHDEPNPILEEAESDQGEMEEEAEA